MTQSDIGGSAPRGGRHRLYVWGVLALYVVLVLGGGSLLGYLTAPDEWYAALDKPPFNPPNWLFGPVWSTLYVLIAIAGWRVWRRGDRAANGLWWTQLVLNFLWSPLFFTLHSLAGALVVILAMLTAILAFIVRAWRVDRPASLLFLPYAAWVGFATLLNASLLILN